MNITEFRNALRALLSDAALSIPVDDIIVAAQAELYPEPTEDLEDDGYPSKQVTP